MRPEVQEIADYIGILLPEQGSNETPRKDNRILWRFFYGESAKILNPRETVLMPDMTADCPMAHMADVETIRKMRKEYDDLAVVCYINSTAALKEYSDVCVTSANAVKIVKELPNKNIFFIPDRNLAIFCSRSCTGKILFTTMDSVRLHERMEPEGCSRGEKETSGAQIVAHGECRAELLAMADYVGSTSGIIQYVTASDCQGIYCLYRRGCGLQAEGTEPGEDILLSGQATGMSEYEKEYAGEGIACFADW